MNRSEEYRALLQELEVLPEELEATVEKALERENTSHKKRRFFGIPAGSLAACFLSFVLLVNCFPTFAVACSNIPLLRELAEAVSFSPSLSAAVENEYVQSIGQTQIKNGINASVEHVIVDRKQVSIFFTLEAAFTDHLDYKYDVTVPEAEMGWSSSTSSFGQKNGELRQIDVNFMEMDVPAELQLNLKVYDSSADWKDTPETVASEVESSAFDEPREREYEYLAEFDFTLEFDPYFTAQGEIIPVNNTFIVDGQHITLTEVEVYPTHLRLNLDDSPENTLWLKGLDLYLENEHGERFESAINGIAATGDPDGEGYASFWLDSPFFSQGEHLTLYITGAQWLEKEDHRVRINLKNGTAEGAAESVRFLAAKQESGGWWVSFAAPREPDGGMYQLFSGHFWDEAGNEYDIMRWSSTFGYDDPKTGESMEDDTMFTEAFPLTGFNGDVIYLEPTFNRASDLTEAPVMISIK